MKIEFGDYLIFFLTFWNIPSKRLKLFNYEFKQTNSLDNSDDS